MGKIETVLKSEIVRLSRRGTRQLVSKVGTELRRLRQRVSGLEREIKAIKAARVGEQATMKIRAATETVAAEQGVRMSPRLLRTLRGRLGISQGELAKLVGVSPGAVAVWEAGRSKPRAATKTRIAALRRLGRREVGRLLAE